MEFIDHTKNIIEIRDLSFSYGKHNVLQRINLCVHRGDYLGVVGPNGGGKTTLIKLILGLLKPDSGEVLIFGEPANKLRDKKRIGYVAQKVTNFDPIFPITASDVVGLGENNDKKNVKWALEKVEMEKYANHLIGELSGGQQQRVFIARALAQKPEIIFLDEPTTGIDAAAQVEFLEFLKKLNREMDITLILISHDINIITEEATEIAYVNKTLTYYDNPKRFLESHKH